VTFLSETTGTSRPKQARAQKRLAPRRRTQAERSATTRRKLLASAIDLICKTGFFDLTLGKVADHAGVSRGAVQHHFGTRTELLFAIIHDFSPDYLRRIEAPRDGSLAMRVDRVINHFWKLYQHKQAIAVFHIWFGARNDSELQPILSKTMARFGREMDRQWEEIFADRHLAPARVSAARRVTFATLRGFAVYLKDRTRWHDELSLLKEMLVAILSSGPA
jgi:AcrR family transcriptional regulator